MIHSKVNLLRKAVCAVKKKTNITISPEAHAKVAHDMPMDIKFIKLYDQALSSSLSKHIQWNNKLIRYLEHRLVGEELKRINIILTTINKVERTAHV